MAAETGTPKAALSAAQRELLARRLKGLRDKPATAPATIPARAAGTPVPLSPPQEGLWLLDRLAPGDPAYNLAWRLELRGALDVAALESSLRAIIQRHESLRTTFEESGESVLQQIAPSQPWALEVLDLRALSESGRMERTGRIVEQAARHPPDLQRGPLLNLHLLRLADEQHVLVLVVHHIVFDGWSLGVFLHELAHEYGARAAGSAAPVEALGIQYGDFAIWQRQQLAGESGARQLAWWKQRLAGAPELLDVPSDRPRPASRVGAGGQETLLLPLATEQALRRMAQEQQATLFVLLFAMFKVLLWRQTGRTDLVVGTPAAGRNRRELERLIGYFVNMLVVRTEVGGDPLLADMVRRVRDSVTESLDHSDVPFDRLVSELHPVRAAGTNPLFQVAFQLLEEGAGMPARLGNLEFSCDMVTNGTSKFDLTMMVNKVPEGLQLDLEYSSEMFDASTARRMLDHYHRLLEEACARPDARISELRMLSEVELGELGGFERGVEEAEWPRGVFVEAFASKARERGQQVAVRCADRSLTYAQLDAESNRIAHALRSLGVGRGAKVGLCLERSERLVAALLGIQKSGAAYVPLDPGFPAERLQYMLTDSGASVLVTADGAASHIEVPAQVQVLDLTAQAADLKAQPDADPGIQIRPEDPAYVIYTSGSTGRPKGVTVPHGALLNFLRSMQREPGLGEQDVLAAVTTISFDIAGLELYLPLLVGARIELVSRQEAIDGQALAARLASSGATVLQATPATWRLLIESGWRGAPGFRALCGGEALPQQLAADLLERVGELWNLYGPTETTIWSTLEQVKAGEPITVGRPIANTQVYVLGPSLERMPVGSPGEIWIGGDGVALGYHDRPELTAERFVADPYSRTPGARLYRTGDLGRWTKQGRLEHLGRADGQVKIRGYRIELGEIEAVMERCEGVRQAAVVVRNAGTGNERLVGCLVMEEGNAIIPDSVRARLSEALPDYMVPRELLSLQSLPLTANGKVDRNALSQLVLASSPQERVTEEPETPEQKRLVDLWMQLLQLPQVGIHENFFDLGGHSLLLARLQAAIRREFGVELSLAEVFQHATVAGLASLLERTDAAIEASPTSLPRAVVQMKPASGVGAMPIFGLPGHNGDILCYRNLGRSLTVPNPVYALQPPGVAGEAEPLRDLTRLADHYYEQISAFSPSGPCIVMGFCAGTGVALQLARRLQASGRLRGVALLGGMHPSNYTRYGRTKMALRWIHRRMSHHLREAGSKGWRGAPAYLWQRLMSVRSGTAAPAAIATTAKDANRRKVEEATLAALATYRKDTRIAAPLGVIVPPMLWGLYSDEQVAAAWREAGNSVQRITCHIADDGTNMLLPPHVDTVASQFAEFISALPEE